MSEFVLPTGTVTLLLADIEGSVRLWESRRSEMAKALAKHDALVTEVIGRHGGVRPKDQGEGDSFVAAFARPSEALACALALQRAIDQEDWGGADIRLRIALHTGEVELRDETNYIGDTINRGARLRDLAHGSQTVLSASTYDLVAERIPERASVKDLGTHRLKDLSRPEHVYQLNHSDLKDQFPGRGKHDEVVHGYMEIDPLSEVEFELITPVWWAWLLAGARSQLIHEADSNLDWVMNHITRRSPLMPRRLTAIP